MNTMDATPARGFYRDADRALLGGVCAGIARYLGFNLRATRFLAFVAILMTMPLGVIAYLVAVFLIPSSSSGEYGVTTSRVKRRKCRSRARDDADVVSTADRVARRCAELDERLVKLEKHVTSRRFQLDQEFRKL